MPRSEEPQGGWGGGAGPGSAHGPRGPQGSRQRSGRRRRRGAAGHCPQRPRRRRGRARRHPAPGPVPPGRWGLWRAAGPGPQTAGLRGLPRNLSSCCGSRLRTCSTFAMFLGSGAPLAGRPREVNWAGRKRCAPFKFCPEEDRRRGRGSSAGCARGGRPTRCGRRGGGRGRGRGARRAHGTHARTHARSDARTHAAAGRPWRREAAPYANSRGGREAARARPSRGSAQAQARPRGGAASTGGRGFARRGGDPRRLDSCARARGVFLEGRLGGPLGLLNNSN